MATEGGEQRTGNAVPVPAPAPVPINVNESMVVWFVCFHGVVSAALLAILVVVLDQGDASHRMREVAKVLGMSSGVEMLVAMLMLALLRNGIWSEVLAFFALVRVLITVWLSARLLYFALFGRNCCFIGDALKAAAPISVVVLGQLALPFWGAKVVVGPCKSGGNSQSASSHV